MNVPLITALEKERRRLDKNEHIQITDVVEIADDPLENLLDRYGNENIATYNGGVWKVGDFLKYLHVFPMEPAVDNNNRISYSI